MYSDSAKNLYRRIMMICCRAWGIPPWEFRARAEVNEINWLDVSECLRLAISSDPFAAYWVEPYLDPIGHRLRSEKVEKRKQIEIGYRRALSQLKPPYASEEDKANAEKIIQELTANYKKAIAEL